MSCVQKEPRRLFFASHFFLVIPTRVAVFSDAPTHSPPPPPGLVYKIIINKKGSFRDLFISNHYFATTKIPPMRKETDQSNTPQSKPRHARGNRGSKREGHSRRRETREKKAREKNPANVEEGGESYPDPLALLNTTENSPPPPFSLSPPSPYSVSRRFQTIPPSAPYSNSLSSPDNAHAQKPKTPRTIKRGAPFNPRSSSFRAGAQCGAQR